MSEKYCVIVTGPTASGKSSIAIQLAQHFRTEIISADSRQCFKELNIGVAKPSAKQLQDVKHYFINSHSIHEEVNAAVFEEYALEKVNRIFVSHETAVMVGGTGLYIKAFCEGLDDIPAAPKKIREEIESAYKARGMEWLQIEVKKHDPEFYAVGEIHNPRRLMRALEVRKTTGKSLINFRIGNSVPRNFKIIKIGLQIPKVQLHQQINTRVDEMILNGLVDEVKSLLPNQYLNALQTVGYSEIFDYLRGKITLPSAIDQIKQNTRQYAKRQMTWFRKDKEIIWFGSGQGSEVVQHLEDVAKRN